MQHSHLSISKVKQMKTWAFPSQLKLPTRIEFVALIVRQDTRNPPREWTETVAR